MDWISAAKTYPIISSGLCGIVGLLWDFKHHETHKITRAGKISLIGIIVSTIVGISAQMFQSSQDSAKALALAQKTDLTLQQTDLTLRKTDLTIYEIQRILSPLDKLKVNVTFDISCTNRRFLKLCTDGRQYYDDYDTHNPEFKKDPWDYWPGGGKNVSLSLEIAAYKDQNSPKLARYLYGDIFDDTTMGDLALDFEGKIKTGPAGFQFEATKDGRITGVIVTEMPVRARFITGDVVSLLDLHGNVIILNGAPEQMEGLMPRSLEIVTSTGQRVTVGHFEKVKVQHIDNWAFFRGVVQ